MTLKSIQIIGQNFEGLKKNFNIINKRNMQMLIFIIRNKTWKFIKKKKIILLLYIVTYLNTKKLTKMAKYSFCPKVLAKCPYFEIRFSKIQISLRNSSF